MSKSNFFNPKKNTPKSRKKFVEEWRDFYSLELWDRNLVESLLHLDIDEDDLENLFDAIHQEKEAAFYEGYEQARRNIRKVLISNDPDVGTTYDTRKAVLDLDEN